MHSLTKNQTLKYICETGGDILSSDNIKKTKNFMQHGGISCFQHSMSVAYVSLKIVQLLGIHCDTKSLVRGALLHDYFLYDWHTEKRDGEPLHGFSHARTAFLNASRDFSLNEVESDIILRHMFPLNITPPRFSESVIVCIADKICASYETLAPHLFADFSEKTA